MILSAIAAIANKQVIGNDNQLPWDMPADLAYFKEVTMGKPIIMGRKTFESIGSALPGRQNIIVSRNQNYPVPEGCILASSLPNAIEQLKAGNAGVATSHDEVMVIGGEGIYKSAMDRLNKLYLTYIDFDTDGDAHFPKFDMSEWHIVSREPHKADDRNPHDYQFIVLERNEDK